MEELEDREFLNTSPARRMDEAFTILRRGLTPFVEDRMASARGAAWKTTEVQRLRQRNPKSAVSTADLLDDSRRVVDVVLEYWREVFSESLKKCHSHFFDFRTAGNTLHHTPDQVTDVKVLSIYESAHYVLSEAGSSYVEFAKCRVTLLKRAISDNQSLLSQTGQPSRSTAPLTRLQPGINTPAEMDSLAAVGPPLDTMGHRSLLSKKVLIAMGAVVGVLAIVVVLQLKNSQGDSRVRASDHESTSSSSPLSRSPVQTSTPPSGGSDHQAPSQGGSHTSAGRDPNATGVQPDPPIQRQPEPMRDGRVAPLSGGDARPFPVADAKPTGDETSNGRNRLQASPSSTDAARAVDAPIKREPPNLVTNGDFLQPWDVGWNKQVGDPTQGSFVVEKQNGMLHMSLSGQNSGQVWQVVALPEGRGLEGLMFGAGVKLIPKRAGMLGLAPPVETALIVQFRDRQEQDLGQIWYTQFATTGLEGSGLAGVPDTLHATGQRCQISTNEGFTRIEESLSRKAKDCLAGSPTNVASLMIVCFMRTSNPQSSAEAFLDRVRLYYR
jgi:Swt1-like HEPN